MLVEALKPQNPIAASKRAREDQQLSRLRKTSQTPYFTQHWYFRGVVRVSGSINRHRLSQEE